MPRTSVHPPYAAFLRVYEPLAAFPEPERAYWQGYAAELRRGAAPGTPGAGAPAAESAASGGPAAHAAPGALDEQRGRLADLIGVPPTAVPEQESRDAFVHEADGVLRLCPWRTRLRSWLALEELKRELPEQLLDAALPPVVRAQAEADWQRWRQDHPDARPWILTSTWHVPVRWLLLFGEEDREWLPGREVADEGAEGAERCGGARSEGVEGEEPRPGVKRRLAPSLRYRTPMAQARRRVARGYRVLRENLDEGPLVAGVEQVGRWLEEFHPRSLVELDYGGLVHAVPESRLAEDASVADVAEGIAALREGDGTRAGAVYRRLMERWRGIQELQYAN